MSSDAIVVSATEFKAKCLALIDEMNRLRVPIIITKRGKPVAQMQPTASEDEPKSLLGALAGSVTIKDDIVAPVIDADAWNALT